MFKKSKRNIEGGNQKHEVIFRGGIKILKMKKTISKVKKK